MDALAGEVNLRRGGVEALEPDAVLRVAVDGVGEVGAEAFDVEVIRSPADLLVRREADAELPVRDAFGQHALGEGHYFGYASLVVRAEQGRAVGRYQRAPRQRFQMREVADGQRQPVTDPDVAAVVVLPNARADVFAGGVGRGVNMRDEAERGRVFAARGSRDLAVNAAILRQPRV